MACKLPHTVEELQRFIKNETENRDVDRQNAIVEVIKKLEAAKQQKNDLENATQRAQTSQMIGNM